MTYNQAVDNVVDSLSVDASFLPYLCEPKGFAALLVEERFGAGFRRVGLEGGGNAPPRAVRALDIALDTPARQA